MKKYDNYAFSRILLRNFKNMLIVLLPLSALICILLFIQLNTEKKSVVERSEATVIKSASIMDSTLRQMQAASLRLSTDERVTRFMRDDRSVLTKKLVENLKKVQTVFLTTINSSPFIDDIVLFLEDDGYYVTYNSGSKYKALEGYESSIIGLNILKDTYPYTDGIYARRSGLFCYKSMVDTLGNRGAILSFVRMSTLINQLNSVLPAQSSQILLTDDLNNVIAASGNSHLIPNDKNVENGLYFADDVCYTVSSCSSSVCNWKFTLILDQNEYYRSYRNLLALTIFTTLSCIVLAVVFAYGFAKRACRPLENMLELLNAPVPITDEEYRAKYQSYDDLGIIATLIHQNKYKAMTLENAAIMREKHLRSAQDRALQAQMNPHFLYNTLESMNWMAVGALGDDNSLSQMIVKLAKLLRSSLQTWRPLIPLQEEIEHAKLYVEIQQMRFDNRFKVKWDIDRGMFDYSAVRLCLQPLIENAINHGLKNTYDGLILIHCYKNEGKLRIDVKDNGRGINPDKLNEIRESLLKHEESDGRYIGLENIASRLNLLFGDDGALSIESQAEISTTVSVTMKLISKEKIDEYLNTIFGIKQSPNEVK